MNTPTFVVDSGGLRKYRTEIPNLIDDLGLSVYAYRLYGHIKRVCGSDGMCWQGTKGLAEHCKMSLGSVSQAKQELKEHGLISIREGDRKSGEADTITISDVWLRNMQTYSEEPIQTLSPHEDPPSHNEDPPSPHESKKEPLEEVTKERLTNVSQKKSRTSSPPKKLKVSDSEAEKRWEALLAKDPNRDVLQSFAAFRATQNQRGEIKLATLWRQIGDAYVRAGASKDALRYGLEEAIRREKPDIRYALAVARNYSPSRANGHQKPTPPKKPAPPPEPMSDEEFNRAMGLT